MFIDSNKYRSCVRTVIVHIIATMAGNLDCPDTVKALSNQDVNKLSNTQLKKALNTILPILNTEVPSEMNSNDLLKTLINNQEKHFEVMINTMRETTSLNQSRLDSEIFDLNKRCDSNEKRIKDLTDKLEQSENKVIVLENELGKCYKEIDELETYQRRPCLVVNNLKTEPSMTDEQVFIKLCKDKSIDENMSIDKIAKVHRLHRSNNNLQDPSKPLALVVKFAKDRYRDDVFKNKKKLKNSGIVITELLTSKRSALLKKCVEKLLSDRNARSIWTDNGKILVKCGSDYAVQIHSEKDIDKIISEKFPQVLTTGAT